MIHGLMLKKVNGVGSAKSVRRIGAEVGALFLSQGTYRVHDNNQTGSSDEPNRQAGRRFKRLLCLTLNCNRTSLCGNLINL